MLSVSKTFKIILSLSTFKRRIILILFDYLVVFLSLLFSSTIKSTSQLETINNNSIIFFALISLVAIFIYFFTKQYKGLTRYLKSKNMYQIIGRNGLVTLLILIIELFLNFRILTFSEIIVFFVILNFNTLILRLILSDLIFIFNKKSKFSKINIAVYGAESLGVEIFETLRYSQKYNLVFFVDEDQNLINRSINNILIISLKKFINSLHKIDQLWITNLSLRKSSLSNHLSEISKNNVKIIKIPKVLDLISNNKNLNDLKPIEIEDLLSREKVDPDPSLLKKGIENLNILITGAGGSIGSEICNQVSKLNPSKIVLFERSEFNLYKIYSELISFNIPNLDIVQVLGCCNDKLLLKNTIKEQDIHVIFHAAAYKHVSIVENNPLQGIYNNIFSSYNICKYASEFNIDKVVLISTDKAVRPSNVMGASKRVAELIFLYFNKQSQRAHDRKLLARNTIFSIVRFGNVLGSSGSVVPLFKKQIKAGGPVTVTDTNVMRYFMTISEASQLVIQASAMSKGGEVFLLDMGNPVKIYQLAQQMILLSGLTIKNRKNPLGDIEITFTGLQKGEKLYEELLVEKESIKTDHPLIFKAKENLNLNDDFVSILLSIKNSIKDQNRKLALTELKK